MTYCSQRESIYIARKAIYIIVLCLAFYASSAIAGGGTPTPSPEFTEAVEGLAGTHSNNDYGQRIINWIAYGQPDIAEISEKSLLSTISFSLNAIALVMMAYLSLLGGSSYVIQTANKGTPGGQVISSFWMPIRIATATILLIPLSSGYSTIQYGVITIAEKGNAHGSYLMNEGIDYIVKHGAYRPPLLESGKEEVYGLVQSELCRLHIDTKEGKDSIVLNKKNSWLHGRALNETLTLSYDKASKDGAIVSFFKDLVGTPKKEYCGAITIMTPDADIGAFQKGTDAKTSARLFSGGDYEDDSAIIATDKLVKYIEKTLIPLTQGIAKKLSSDSDALSKLQNGGGKAAQSTYEKLQKTADKSATTLQDELNKIVSDYDKKKYEIIQESIISINKKNSTSGAVDESAEAPWVKQLKASGWTALGTVFWQISKNQEALNYLAKRLKASYKPPLIDGQYADDERYITLLARFTVLSNEAKKAKKDLAINSFDMSALEVAGTDGSAGILKSTIAGWFQGVMQAMFISGDDGDLISKLQYSGSVLASLADLIVHASIWGDAAGKTSVEVSDRVQRAAESSASAVPVVGALTSAAASAGSFLLTTPTTFIGFLSSGYMQYASTLVVPMLIAGFALAVVLPAIPLFFWLMGVVSWMMFFVECLLVSPSWLAAHGTADKDGWGTEHTRQGYMLMIGLYLNPILRVAGFFAIFLALIPISTMVGWLSQYLQGVIASGWLSPAIIVGAMVVLAVFAYSAAVRVFSLPNELFERGLRWINGGQEVTGDSSAEQQNRTIIAQVGGKADSAASAARHLRQGSGGGVGGGVGGGGGATPTPTSPR